MNSIAEASKRPHPSWCAREHGDLLAHSAQIGADIELTSDISYGIYLHQQNATPTELHLFRHDRDKTGFTRFSLLEAAILSDLIREALGAVAREAGLR